MLAAEAIGIARDDAFAFDATGAGVRVAMSTMSADVVLKRTRSRS